MAALKSSLGLALCVVYLMVAALALFSELTRKPSPLIFLFDLAMVVALPGLLVLMIPLGLLGVQTDSIRTPLLIASAILTAGMVYLLGAGAEALYRAAYK
jgi:hypothetical protein